jgi:hypothetical protein
MKKIITPARKESAVYYSDFTGKCFDSFGPNASLTLEFNYGSKYDSNKIQLHLSDEDAEKVLDFIKTKISKDCMDVLKKKLSTEDTPYNKTMDFRDWSSCSQIVFSEDLLRRLTE